MCPALEMGVADTLSASASLCAEAALLLGWKHSFREIASEAGETIGETISVGVCAEDFAGAHGASVFSQGLSLGPHKQVFEAMVLRLSLRISMRSTDMSLSVERLCVSCDGVRKLGNLAGQTDFVRLPAGLRTEFACERDVFRCCLEASE